MCGNLNRDLRRSYAARILCESRMPNPAPMSEPKKFNNTYLALGIAIGVALGVAIDNLAIGLAIGVALGISLGAYQKK
jgi:zinc transporter ZupT